MAQLRQDYNQFVKRDAEVIAIGPEDAASFSRHHWVNDAASSGPMAMTSASRLTN